MTEVSEKIFIEYTSIHGLKFVHKRKTPGWIKRTIWFALIIAMCSLLALQFESSFSRFFKYDIATAFTYENVHEDLNFPALTFCSSNIFRKSAVGSSKTFLLLATLMFSAKDSDYAELKRENIQYCYQPSKTKEKNPLDDPIGYLSRIGFEQFLKNVGMSSTISVEKCWLRTRSINCSKITFNHFTDSGLCFTINPEIHNEIYKTVFGSMLDSTNEIKLTVPSAGPYNAFRLLLNVQQEEYCGHFQFFVWPGAGFTAFVHGQTEGVAFQESPGIYLEPGKVYSMVLKTERYKRETEDLGLCRSVASFQNLGLSGAYLYSACKYLCYVRFTMAKCKCLPVIVGNNKENISKILQFNSAEMEYGICGSKLEDLQRDLECFTEITVTFTLEYDPEKCPDCLPQCRETRFESTVTESLLSNGTIEAYGQDFGNKTPEEIRKNYLFLNIYFESKKTMTITEYQAYKKIDLFNSVGGSLGLFMGMSAMSLYEPFDLLLVWLWKKFARVAKATVEKRLEKKKVFHANARQRRRDKKAKKEEVLKKSVSQTVLTESVLF